MSLLQITGCRSKRHSFDFVTYVPMDFNFTLIFFILMNKGVNLHMRKLPLQPLLPFLA